MSAAPLDPRAPVDPPELAPLVCAELKTLLAAEGTEFAGEAAVVAQLAAQVAVARLRHGHGCLVTRHAAA